MIMKEVKNMGKETKIEFRISEEDKKELQEILEEKGISLSVFLRNCIYNFIKGEKENASKN